jgi:hypothetical protein
MSRAADTTRAKVDFLPEQADEIRAQLERILQSHQFRTSQRCLSLLRYVTEQTLAGETQSLKERTIGVEVFGRPPDYDTGQDPIVRATAAETRKKLAQYYQEPEHSSEVLIELRPGSYIVVVLFNEGTADSTRQPGRKRAIIAGGAALLLIVLTAVLAMQRRDRSALDRFWSPLVESQGPILISLGQPIAYNLKSFEAQDAIQGIGTPPPGFATQQAIPMKDLIILPDRYVALGDAVCLSHITHILDGYAKAYRVRGERSISFEDLRESPAVLVGAFDNQWTLRLAGQLRFTFQKGAAPETDIVLDHQHPENKQWSLTGAWPHWDVAHDYAIVSRVLDTTTARPVVIAAGITHYGTMAAGEFLSNPDYFSEAARQLPPGWENKNVQIVLHVPVVKRVPGRARVLAIQVW